MSLCRSSHRRCSVKKDVLKNFAIFTGKHLCWRFLIKLQAWRLQHRIFFVIIQKFLRTRTLKNTCERLLLPQKNSNKSYIPSFLSSSKFSKTSSSSLITISALCSFSFSFSIPLLKTKLLHVFRFNKNARGILSNPGAPLYTNKKTLIQQFWIKRIYL